MRRLSNIALHSIFGLIAGSIYLLIELLWRGYTHWTMLPLAAIIFVCTGILDELKVPLSFWKQVLLGTAIATLLEFIAGLILNLWLEFNVWDYSDMPFNFMGQICPQYTFAWAVLMAMSIELENVMHKIVEKL